jgi:hypothetical protein
LDGEQLRRRRLAAAPTSSIIPFQDREMIGMTGPGAVAARGASEMDELSGHVVLKSNRQQLFAQVPVHADVIASHCQMAQGTASQNKIPVAKSASFQWWKAPPQTQI